MFDPEPIDSTSPAASVTLNNVGLGPLTIFNVAIAGIHPGDFLVVADECRGRRLAPGAGCEVWLRFRPTGPDTRRANLLVENSDTIQLAQVELVGSGVQSQPDLVVADLRPTGPARIALREEQIVLPLRVVVENRGDAPAGSFVTLLGCTDRGQRCSVDTWLLFFETEALLQPGEQATFTGLGAISLKYAGRTVQVAADADSCAIEPPAAFCRVEESNEGNNTRQISVDLPELELPDTTPPEITIVNPKASARFEYDGYDEKRRLWYKDMILEGQAFDPEEGLLEPSKLVWTTDRSDIQDGLLGYGTQVNVRLYSNRCTGVTHRITFSATDSSGNVSTDQREISLWTLC